MAHITRKELKEDAIQEAGVNAYDYMSSHLHQVLIGILVVLAILLAVIAAQKYSQSHTYADNAELYAAQQQYANAVNETDATKRKEDIAAAIEACDLLNKKRPNSPAGHEALLVKGNCYCLSRDYENALRTFEEYVQKSRDDEQKAKGKVAIGDTLSNQAFDAGDKGAPILEKAKQAYAEAEKLGVLPTGKKSYLHYQAAMGSARVLTQAGDLAGAKQIYETVIKERPFYDEKLTSSTLEDMGAWAKADRSAKAILLRKSLLESRAASGFEKTAERRLEEVNARLKAAAKP
jgi:tetratricopeptide (TPR) repeat protein